MARINANNYRPDAAPELWPAADYLVCITSVDWVAPLNKTPFLSLTYIRDDGETFTEQVRGMNDNGKGPWIARVVSALSLSCATSLPAPKNATVRPCEDMDWESEADCRAALLGGILWLPVEIEAGTDDGKGGRYPDKNKGRYLMTSDAASEDIARFRSSETWDRCKGRINDMRKSAVAEWAAALEPSKRVGAAPAPVVTAPVVTAPTDDGFTDDGIPF
jgi:hypothetical protein